MAGVSEGSIVTIVVAVVGALVGLGSAGLAYRQAYIARRENRQERLEARLARAERDNRLLWLWSRRLVDHIYRGEQPPPPEAPAGLFEDTAQRKDVLK
ncbi:hypothetical protein SAMN04515691_2979 [Leifsonia sp. 98AMF]|nr:hypothetical protein [Leifsonia sp. 467MF]SDH16293.1 hypothetical protein SAMN04515690_1037 [Leifsonia sp. 197AMF]SDJ21991.1 hypothetical protein SAMN04515684_2745 [Leifsonia sp. 466MF]SDK61775.1 hypothetical protein SAMN04515683_4019 [Leifsonia sp. 157MF]SDN43671.1 hypothetical protein SAMN04515686_0929 [Leifsonia sp. 509MF]SFM57031.1 hypothetical protein SAMN04515691_2979 [Leifsonia sp. 98AMF]